jgi:hypothetical protein
MRRRLLYAVAALGVLILLIIGGSVARLLPVGTTAESACRIAMGNTEGYGLWRYQGRLPSAVATQLILDYSDGFNTAGCHVRSFGPIWVAEPVVDQTLIGCSLGLDKGMCPRARYGVAP